MNVEILWMLLMSYIQRGFFMKIQKYVFEKCQNYNTAIRRQEKRQRAVSYFKEAIDKKYPHFPTRPFSVRTVCSRHRFSLYLNCLKSLRSAYLSSYLLYWLLLFIIVSWSNRLEAYCSFLAFSWEHEIEKVVWGCNGVSATAIC